MARRVFEGIRCYETKQGPAIFRLREHMQRLLDSAHIYRMDLPYSLDELCAAGGEVVRANNMQACYLKPIVMRGYGEVGVNPFPCPVEVYMACWDWGKYLGPEAQEKGVDVCVSSWARMAPNTLPAMSKAAAKLFEFAAHPHGSHDERLRRRHRAGHQWLRQRRLR